MAFNLAALSLVICPAFWSPKIYVKLVWRQNLFPSILDLTSISDFRLAWACTNLLLILGSLGMDSYCEEGYSTNLGFEYLWSPSESACRTDLFFKLKSYIISRRWDPKHWGMLTNLKIKTIGYDEQKLVPEEERRWAITNVNSLKLNLSLAVYIKNLNYTPVGTHQLWKD